jgi:PKD domain
MRNVVATGLVLALLMAGCAAKDTATTSATGTKGTAGSGTGAATGTGTAGAGGPNQPPHATIALSNSTGAVPFNATFALTGTDPDGDALNFTLSFGDGSAMNGSKLPTNVTHRFATLGNFTAMLVVTDGKHTVNATVTVHVVKGLAASPPQKVTGSWTTGGPVSCEQFADEDDLHQTAGQTAGIDYVKFAVRADTMAKKFHVDVKSTNPVGGWEVDFYDAGGKNLDYFDSPLAPTPTTVDGDIPVGSVTGIFFACTAGGGSFTYTAG